jgi:hypothetical protein
MRATGRNGDVVHLIVPFYVPKMLQNYFILIYQRNDISLSLQTEEISNNIKLNMMKHKKVVHVHI